MNPNRGRESRLHREAKIHIGCLFEEPGWSVFYEQRNADILVLYHASRFVAAIEVESSPKNVVRNIERNMAHGCNAVAVVSIKEQFHNQVANKIKTCSTATAPVQLFACDAQSLRQLRNWLLDFVQNPANKEENP